MINEFLNKLLNFEDLAFEQARTLMNDIMQGQLTPVQIAALLIALRMKKETVEEIAGMASSMREHANQISPAGDLVDTCGTGGDLSHSFNISTTAALIAASCGVKIAKHGNRNISSKCGCADLLESLGLNIDLTPPQVEACINTTGFGFMFAPKFHLSMKYAVVPRKELGVRTIFNILGPLTNPAKAKRQLLGVFRPELTVTLASVLKNLGTEKAMVVHGLDGLDEISLSANTQISELNNNQIRTYEFNPEDIGLTLIRKSDIIGGDVANNAHITRNILTGKEQGPKAQIALLNTAAVLLTADKVNDLREGIDIAQKAISTGAAQTKLEEIITFTRKYIA